MMKLSDFLPFQSHNGLWTRWRRQVSSEVVRLRVQRTIVNSTFLSKTLSSQRLVHTSADIDVIQREMVQVGEFLGVGYSAQVFEISYRNESHKESEAAQHGSDTDTENDDDDNDNNDKNKADQLSSSMKRGQYVIKQMHPDVLDHRKTCIKDLERAATDMIMEVAYLSRFTDNPNIVTLCGVSPSIYHSMFDLKSDKLKDTSDILDYYFVMERIPETLDQRIIQWGETQPRSQRKQLIARQCSIALQLAQVLAFLQQRRLVYRDLSPRNCGLQQGDLVQLFDFGTCRELPPELSPQDKKTLHGRDLRTCHFYHNSPSEQVFHMSMAGTRRYCAPEVITSRLYNGKCDVYSWAMCCAHLFSLKEPFAGYSKAEHIQKVVLQQERPPLAQLGLPHSLEELLRHAWATDLLVRPNMQQVLGHMELIVKNDVVGR